MSSSLTNPPLKSRPQNMKTILKSFAAIFLLVFAFSICASGQNARSSQRRVTQETNASGNNGNPVLNAAGSVAMIVVRSAGKVAWATTKFTASEIAKPLVVKVTPMAAKFALKASGVAIKRLLPFALKLAILL